MCSYVFVFVCHICRLFSHLEIFSCVFVCVRMCSWVNICVRMFFVFMGHICSFIIRVRGSHVFVQCVGGSYVFVYHLCSWVICLRIPFVFVGHMCSYNVLVDHMCSYIVCVRGSHVSFIILTYLTLTCVRIPFVFVGHMCSYIICVRGSYVFLYHIHISHTELIHAGASAFRVSVGLISDLDIAFVSLFF